MENAKPAPPVRIGRLLPGYVCLDDGVNAPVRGMAETDSGEISVIAKKLGARALAVEILCAVYGRGIGLPIPEPLMIFDDDLGWLYGSVDVGHPNLAKFISTDSATIREKLLAWPAILPAACFDELVVNSDRHDGNILFDGLDFTLVDHDMCLPSGMASGDEMSQHHSNILLDILLEALPEGDLGKRKLLKDSDAWIATRHPEEASSARASIDGVCTEDVQNRLTSFINERLLVLSSLMAIKVNPDQGRLNV
jgi:hypothetical protein